VDDADDLRHPFAHRSYPIGSKPGAWVIYLLSLLKQLDPVGEMAQSFREGLAKAWKAWVHLASKIANVQARIILTIFYFLALLPFGLVVRLFADPLRTKKRPTQWIDRAQEVQDILWARQL
jgi:hypothetical protein